jgi:hypothetical protein
MHMHTVTAQHPAPSNKIHSREHGFPRAPHLLDSQLLEVRQVFGRLPGAVGLVEEGMIGAKVVVLRELDRMGTGAKSLRVDVLVAEVDSLFQGCGRACVQGKYMHVRGVRACEEPSLPSVESGTSVRVAGRRPTWTTAMSRHRPVMPATADAILPADRENHVSASPPRASRWCGDNLEGDIIIAKSRGGKKKEEQCEDLLDPDRDSAPDSMPADESGHGTVARFDAK